MNPSRAPRQDEIIQSLRNELKKSKEDYKRLKLNFEKEIAFLESNSCEKCGQSRFQSALSSNYFKFKEVRNKS